MDFLLHYTPIAYLTQSLWRDEAFSVMLALRSLSTVFHITFEPPFYYILLHFWVKLFGTGEIAVRSLSLTGFTLALVIVIRWGEKLFKKHWLSWYLPLFFFFNPMLLYYAFEARAYGWYIFFTVAALFTYTERWWTLYILATVLGLYTHTYMVFVPLVILIHHILSYGKNSRFFSSGKLVSDPLIRSDLIITILYSPWVYKLVSEFSRLKETWYFPVDTQLVKSVVANIFLGYEGTPHFLWPVTAKISIILLTLCCYAMFQKKFRLRNSLFFLLTFFPLVTVIGISVFKPLFVNRYLIPATIGEIFLVVFAIENIRHKLTSQVTAALLFGGIMAFNLWYPAYNTKKDLRRTLTQVNALINKNDVILVDDALILYETTYYSRYASRVYWYNPYNYSFPWYIGDVLFTRSQSVQDIPSYPIRAFIIHLDGSFEVSYKSHITDTSGAPPTTVMKKL